MRRQEILFEGVKEYLTMFNGFPPQSMKAITATVKDATDGLKRADRIVWYLRYYRVAVVSDLISKGAEFSDKQQSKLASSVSYSNFEDAAQRAIGVVSNFQTFKHYVDLKLPAIDKIVWDKQPPEELLTEMHTAEKKWQENLKHSVRHDGDEDMVLDCGNGWAWFNLNTHYCQKEAGAMGHCGNAGGNHNQTILSLRKHVQDDRWTPRATFILDRHTGILGEMKGRFNEKPEEKYHPQIVALLRHDIIRGVKGGGYLPQNNFNLNDLDPDEADKLKKEKPGLQDTYEVYKEWHEAKLSGAIDSELDEVFQEKLEAELGKFRYKDINWEKEKIIITKQRDVDFFRDYTDLETVEELLGSPDKLLGLIKQYAPKNTNAEFIATEVCEDHYVNVMEYFINNIPYEFNGTFAQWDIEENIVEEMISISDFLYADEEINQYTEELNSVVEYSDYEPSTNPIYGDEVDEAIVKHVTSDHGNIGARDLIETILQEYENIYSKGGSHTINDPNQLSFDFGK